MADDTKVGNTHNNVNETEVALDEQENELDHRPVEGTLDDEGVYIEQLQNGEVRISSNNFGNVIPKATQVMDYLHRDEKSNCISIWDFVAQVNKVKKGKKKKKMKSENTIDEDSCTEDEIDNDNELTSDIVLDNSDELEDSEEMETDQPSSTTEQQPLSADDILHSLAKTHPFGELQTGHYESCTHFQRVRRWENRFIPVPIGPKMPQQDQEFVYPKYCHLMLILFKPWRSVTIHLVPIHFLLFPTIVLHHNCCCRCR
jgi:hypothetical protein